MTNEPGEVVRRYYMDLAELDRLFRDPATSDEERNSALEAAVARWHEDCEWRPDAAALVEDAAFRGRGGLRGYFSMLAEVMESVEIDLDEVQQVGESVVALGRVRARGRGSGAVIEEEHGVVYGLRDGLIVRGVSYRDHAKAREAATRRD